MQLVHLTHRGGTDDERSKLISCSWIFQIKVWQIPETGLKTNLTEWLVDLHGHTRRVGYIEWHPTAENMLLSAGYDFKVRSYC